MSAEMRAAVIDAPGSYEVRTVPRPVCDRRGLLVRVLACGLCGSDLRTLRSGHHRVTLPFVVGHEICGRVEETGDGYTGQWRTGDLLSIAPLMYCGTCEFCREGRLELCEQYREIGQHVQGGFAEYLAVPPAAVENGTIQKIPEGLDPVYAAVAEPICSCINAQEKGQVTLGETVVILGAGPIGCIHAALARARGADTIIIADINRERLKLCEPFNPDHLILLGDIDPVERVRSLTGGKGAHVVITANPAPQSQIDAITMARKGGRILLFGGLPADRACPGINTNQIHYNALTVMGTTIFAPRHQVTALKLLRRGVIDGHKLVSHRFTLEEFQQGAGLALEGKVLKAVFIP